MAFPQVGETAPDFTAQTDTGETLKLSDLRGKRVVLYFYPKADTPGCTRQACSIRDNYQRFRDVDVVVLGASPDTIEEQAAFKAKYDLPFTLLADPEHELADLYGVWGTHQSTFKGVEYTTTGAKRSTVIIEPDGTVSYAQFGVDATKNPGELLDILEKGAPTPNA
jgi:thioredoxin-dependent peroxiredoxin